MKTSALTNLTVMVIRFCGAVAKSRGIWQPSAIGDNIGFKNCFPLLMITQLLSMSWLADFHCMYMLDITQEHLHSDTNMHVYVFRFRYSYM